MSVVDSFKFYVACFFAAPALLWLFLYSGESCCPPASQIISPNITSHSYCAVLHVFVVITPVQHLYCHFRGPVELKKKYKCDWALVTGAGSGIGKSLAETLALQGLNVVLVSLPMKDLDETFDTLKSQFPKQEFRKYVVCCLQCLVVSRYVTQFLRVFC